MSDDLRIPKEHWLWDGPIDSWENSLRKNVREEPDPAVRFDKWLSAKAKGEGGYGVRLLFIEEPYLGWAEKVEQAIATEEKSLRESIAYHVTNPNDY